MNRDNYTLRVSAVAMLLALSLRLLPVIPAALQDPRLLSLLVYLQTGRIVRYESSATIETTLPQHTAPPATEETHLPTAPSTEPPATQTVPPVTTPEVTSPVLTPEDLSYIDVHYSCSLRPDIGSLLLAPLQWDLEDGAPRVLILHSHATESYTPDGSDTYAPSGDYRTLEETQNMLSIGEEVARLLKEAGIGVIHDTTLHDYPSYNLAYSEARATVQKHLQENPSICLVLDLHRDAAGTADNQFTTSATVGGERSAQLMMVVGTNYTGWGGNLSLALKLTALLERQNPGICRPLDLRGQRFNMDLSPGSLLVEIGAAGNTRQEALTAARALAESIISMANGVITEMSTNAD